MARFDFYVGRKGHAGVKCTANAPGPDQLPTMEAGAIEVQVPGHGTVRVGVTSALDMLVQALTIQLQNGVRDLVFPPQDTDSKSTTKRSTGFVTE